MPGSPNPAEKPPRRYVITKENARQLAARSAAKRRENKAQRLAEEAIAKVQPPIADYAHVPLMHLLQQLTLIHEAILKERNCEKLDQLVTTQGKLLTQERELAKVPAPADQSSSKVGVVWQPGMVVKSVSRPTNPGGGN